MTNLTFDAGAAVARSPHPRATSFRRLAAWSIRLGLIATITLLLLNAGFVVVRLADGLIPKAQTAAALRDGYDTGAMTVEAWPRNALQGRDRYSDCITAQIAVLGDDTQIKNALAPRLMSPEQVGHGADVHNACEELQRYLAGRLQPQPGVTYTRFWHGAATALVAALALMPLDGYRALLLDLTLGLIAATAVCAALAGPRLLLAMAPLLVASFVFGGQMGYGELISYGPAAIASWSIALALVLLHRRLSDEFLVSLAVTAGAAEAFFDQMISVPLAAAIFVAVAGTCMRDRGDSLTKSVARMAGLAALWGFGLAGSYAIKLGLSTWLIGPGAFEEFAHQLVYRAGTVDPDIGLDPGMGFSRLFVVGLALLRGCKNLWRLGYTDTPGLFNDVIGFVGIAGWALAASSWVVAFRAGRGARCLASGAGYIVASLVIVGWFVVFPEHALRHTFTVRTFVLWIAGGWGCLLSGWVTLGRSERLTPGQTRERSASQTSMPAALS